MRNFILIPALTIVAACVANVESIEPGVTQYTGDHVAIYVFSRAIYLSQSDKTILKGKMQAKADETCRQGDATRADEYDTQKIRKTGEYTYAFERTYRCV